MKIELKKLKVYKELSDETTAITATLVVDGVAAATVQNDGQGGANRYHVTDRAAFEMAAAHVAQFPAKATQYGEMAYDMDLFVDELVNKIEAEKWERRECKKMTMFRVPGDNEGSFRTVRAKFSEQVKAFILSKYPAAEIINLRYDRTVRA